jgi:phosphoribosylaminoimidazole-succinocarboxamide synthase
MPENMPLVAIDPHALGLPLVHRGKVRDSYAAGNGRLLLVASDRLSAFDRVLPNGVPDKGRVLNRLSAFWFGQTGGLMANHLVSADWTEIARWTGVDAANTALAGRSMLVKRAERIDVECVVRGYLAGSGWSEYRAQGTLAGEPLMPGLQEGQELPRPAFTPAIKNEHGHDENISVARLRSLAGAEMARRLEARSRALYAYAHRYALPRGIIIADTKFEFGLCHGELTLIDEALTPDCSRFWDADAYRPGGFQASFDKQPVRDYLAALGWHGEDPIPSLPAAVVAATTERYRAAYVRLTGQGLDD